MNKKHFILWGLAALLTLAATGCNTMHGVGKDVERAGEKIQDNANRHR
ncbi:MAG TPA: entericidin A/B family lipoprotein [Opitutus sp.]|nr:entericidin A/B family lipoprotein [Opitutus sp.]